MTDNDTTPSPPNERIDGPVTMPSDASGWWERERAEFVRSRLEALTGPGDLIVDVGCGRGDMLDTELLSDRRCVNVDSHLWDEWADQNNRLFVVAEADALPFRDGAFNLVGSFDVLEHIPDDGRALDEQCRIASDGRPVVAAVPADARLWSGHDEAVGHCRRYHRSDFEALAADRPLAIEWSSHFYSFLWPPAWLFRKSPVRQTEPSASSGLLGRLAERVIGLLSAAERAVLGRRRSIPFGSSFWVEMTRRQR